MTIFELEGYYRYPNGETLAQFNKIARDNYVLKIAQDYFDQSGVKNLHLGCERDEGECLMRDGLLLAYFFSERGGRNLIALFTSVYVALDFIACRHLGIKSLPLDWPELNRQFDEQSRKQ